VSALEGRSRGHLRSVRCRRTTGAGAQVLGLTLNKALSKDVDARSRHPDSRLSVDPRIRER
jgi:hypothetical protein